MGQPPAYSSTLWAQLEGPQAAPTVAISEAGGQQQLTFWLQLDNATSEDDCVVDFDRHVLEISCRGLLYKFQFSAAVDLSDLEVRSFDLRTHTLCVAFPYEPAQARAAPRASPCRSSKTR